MDRRTFVKITSLGSLAFATSCSLEGEEHLYSQVKSQEDMVTGQATWYAATCRECPAGCGVLAKNREGRVIKLEGNPLHPINSGKLCIRGQSALQAVYNPDRLRYPLLKDGKGWKRIRYDQATRILREKIGAATARGGNRVRMITQIEGAALSKLFTECTDVWRSPQPLVFEPLAYESLKEANRIVFGISGLPSYRIDRCDVLLGFGADFLETWLSPVEYARQFKAMHAYGGGAKGLFYHVGPYRSLTAANSDTWVPCRPGAELMVGLGLIKEILQRQANPNLPAAIHREIASLVETYSREQLLQAAGISEKTLLEMAGALLKAKSPLVLGTGALSHSSFDVQTNIVVNLLNYLLDPELKNIDFSRRHRIELASSRREQLHLFDELQQGGADAVLLNEVNPAYALPGEAPVRAALQRKDLFVASFSSFLDETSELADLVVPTSLPLESWGEFGGYPDLLSTLQPAMRPLNQAPHVGDILLRVLGRAGASKQPFKGYLVEQLHAAWGIGDTKDWLQAVSSGGRLDAAAHPARSASFQVTTRFAEHLRDAAGPPKEGQPGCIAVPSIRFYDGRGANRPWLCEIPDPLSKVAWQSTLLVHPETARDRGIAHGDIVVLKRGQRAIQGPVFETDDVLPGWFALPMGQGHRAYGRYAKDRGVNPAGLLDARLDPLSGGGLHAVSNIDLERTGRTHRFAHTDGSIDQHGRKIALTVSLEELQEKPEEEKHGLGMHEFPFTLPLPEGYHTKRDFYPPHEHEDYRWAMVVDLDRCIGCNACAAACYAENNLGVVGEEEVINGREMSWLHIERYRRMDDPDKLIFLPMLCQHCDNAPCESVCPVFAPHHNKEGLNNQIYNRCIGTRFCAQNCPYKVRRFNWFEWRWPDPLHLQLNPDVTVRTKGVMEKCSFCIQRIKEGHNHAKNEGRMIRDGEVTPACVQTCPTEALVFGSLMDDSSRVSKLVRDRRAYQVMGYLNTKPAVIYLRKVVR